MAMRERGKPGDACIKLACCRCVSLLSLIGAKRKFLGHRGLISDARATASR
jgi:hypothetical protein